MVDIDRRLLPITRELTTDFRAVVINGPRQAGKSTLVRQLQNGRGPLVSLDDLTSLSVALTDPVGFLAGLPRHIAIDEFQRGGDALLLSLKRRLDEDRARGQYVLAGSTRFLTTRRLSETLTGRIAIAELLPLSAGEIRSSRTGAHAGSFIDDVFMESPVDQLLARTPDRLTRADHAEMIAVGGFPEVVLGPTTDRFRRTWGRSYIETVTALTNVEQVAEIRRPALVGDLLRQMAARSAQEIVVSDLARELRIDEGTVRTYLDTLETLYLIRMVPAWSTSHTNRAKKRSVGHVLDTSLACFILGVTSKQLASVDSRWFGPLLESFVVGELVKQLGWSETDARILQYRDRDQREVDVLLEQGNKVVAIEVKATATPTVSHARHMAAIRDRVGTLFHLGIVLHTGSSAVSIGDRLVALPVSALWSV